MSVFRGRRDISFLNMEVLVVTVYIVNTWISTQGVIDFNLISPHTNKLAYAYYQLSMKNILWKIKNQMGCKNVLAYPEVTVGLKFFVKGSQRPCRSLIVVQVQHR